MSSCSGEFVEQWTVVSPKRYNSAHSSPSQLVPQFECPLDSLPLSEDVRDVETPFLMITEQPQAYYKFRYKSEMQNSHGCLHGKSYVKNSNERYFPGVELFNYNGPAIIKCKLAQINNEHEHPHRLCVNDVSDISFEVPKGDSYKAWFSDLCIVHTPSKEVTNWLYRGHNTENLSSKEKSEIMKQCESMAKMIQLNIVRLKFSALHPVTGVEICAPVFSDSIRNSKSAATNILKICRMSRTHGRVRGGDDVFMLVEKVMKKNIMVRFFELDEDGKETWTDTGKFAECDVHHQYAIVFSTPPYKDLKITKRVQVFVELVRRSDGKKSDPKEFYYTPEHTYEFKKRKYNQLYGNQQSVPVTSNSPNNFLPVNQTKSLKTCLSNETKCSQVVCDEKGTPVLAQSSLINQHNNEMGVLKFKIPVAPLQSNDAGSNASVSNAFNIVNDMDLFQNSDFTDYFDSLLNEFDGLVADTGRGKVRPEPGNEEDSYDDQTIIDMMAKELQIIVEMIRIKREKFTKCLQALFDLRLSNGDTFLHLTLGSKQPLLEYLINLIHDTNLTHLLNIQNASAQTILHQAVANNLCYLIPLLVSKGCDPMLEDLEGNNAFHYGVKSEDSLGPLLDATKMFDVPRDLDVFNYEKQTPLHLAVLNKSVESARLLLASGASCSARDGAGRTPLHLAALDDALPVAKLLLEHTHSGQVNEVDDIGYTALQIVCDKHDSETSIEMVKLLLNNKADPMQHQKHSLPAWQLAKSKPAIRDVLQEYIPEHPAEQANCDSEEEFESADEGDCADEDVAEITDPLKRLTLITKDGA